MPSLARRPRPAPSIPIQLGPWKGVRDLGDSGAQDPMFAQDAINVWFQDPQNGGSVWARPGFQKLTGTTGLETSSAIQGLFGMAYPLGNGWMVFAFVNGKVYRQSGATSWTDVTPVGVTISNSAVKIFAILYNGEMIVNDGVNEPWRGTNLTSTPITGTEIEINTAGAAWVAWGKPTVHGGKLFFIVQTITATDYGNRIVWSEEASAATGYLQDGFTNSWDLIQSPVPAQQLLAIQGTNTGLYYFRNYSIGVIYGAVNADFVTGATHDGISNSVGILGNTPATGVTRPEVCLANNYLWFVNSQGHPVRMRVGSTVIEPLWQQMRNRLQRIRQTDSGTSIANLQYPDVAYSADLDKVVMLFLEDDGNSTAGSKHLYVFDANTGSYEGRWIIELTAQPANENPTAVRAYRIAAAQRSDQLDMYGLSTFLVGGTNAAGSAGHVYHQTPMGFYGINSVSLGDNAGAMHMSLTTMLTPDEQNVEFHVQGVSVEALPDSGTLSLDQYTPRGAATSVSMTGITNSDSIQSSHDHGIYRAGLHQFGRWWRGVFHWNVASGATPYAFERATLTVKPRRTIGVTK